MITVSNLAMSYGDRVLFKDASFQLQQGGRYGLVGANGSGKTTLLNILSGDLAPTAGTVTMPRSVRLGVLRQDQFLYEDHQILEVVLAGHPELWRAMSEKEALLARAHESFDADRFSQLEETIQRLDGYSAESRAATILEGLGIPTPLHRQPLSVLSGGFKLRVLLAQVLAGAPDVLLLDEPTNHLDIVSIRWLEKFLAEFPGPVVVISHDHRFLDNVATHILDVDYETISLYHGNYTSFVEQKRAERERREIEIENRRKEIAHHQQFVDRFRAKASKARQAQSKLRLIEKKAAELQELPGSSRRYPRFQFEPIRPSGRDVVHVRGVRKSFGDREVLHGVDLTVRRGERVVLIGPNGVGKSTLLKIMVGELAPDAGTVEWGYETRPGYFAQDHHEQLRGLDRTAEQWLWDFCPDRDRGFVRGLMGMLLFSGDDAARSVHALSGGEAARLVLGRLSLERPNVLVLDEPTNHLDMESIEALAASLERFDGTIILVSHDRWFVRRLATRVIEISPDGIRDHLGSYDEYIQACGDDHLDVGQTRTDLRARRSDRSAASDGAAYGGRTAAPNARRPAMSRSSSSRHAIERRIEAVTASLEAAEARIAEIDDTFCAPGFFASASKEEVMALEQERSRLHAEIDALLREWESLEAQLSGAT